MKQIPSPSRFRPSFNWGTAGLRAAVVLAAAVSFGVAQAQTQSQETTIELASPILVIDQDRLFAETNLGTAAADELEERARLLAEENQQIEATLIAEERDLTQKRTELPTSEFRVLADAFDQKVQVIRAEQDEKARALTRARDEVRGNFFQNVAGIISAIVRDRGALLVIDRRDVFLSAERIDITDEAIERVNASNAEANE